jgi:parvulin-like peptidyl-prolyl isomerase
MENEEKKDLSTSEGTVETVETPVVAKKMMNAKLLLGGVVGALVVAALGFYGFVFMEVKKLSTTPIVMKTAKALHMPAVKVDGQTLLYVDYNSDIAALKKLSSNPQFAFGPATDQDLSDLVVANFLTNLKTKQIAEEYKVSVEQTEIDEKRKELVSQFGEEQVKKSIEESYGWDIDTFVNKIIVPSILNTKVKEAYEKAADPKTATLSREEANVSHILVKVADFKNKKEVFAAKKKIQTVLARVKKGEDFAALAKEFSDDGSKEQGGSLGWVPRGATVPPFDNVAFTLEVGKISDVVETTFGYHILKVEDRHTVADFNAYIDAEVKKMKPEFVINIHNPLDVPAAPAPAVDVAPEVEPAPAAAPAPAPAPEATK